MKCVAKKQKRNIKNRQTLGALDEDAEDLGEEEQKKNDKSNFLHPGYGDEEDQL